MNYFGHAAIATLRDRDPRFVLGAMLPDLLPMVGIVAPKFFEDSVLNAGVTFHLETDALFHETQSFLTWNRTALLCLRDLGVSRGPARACAHMGVEMLIDAELCRERDFFSAYEQALTFVRDRPNLLAPVGALAGARAQALLGHLLQRGRLVFECSEERFSVRLGRTLDSRPRLRPSTQELTVISAYLAQLKAPREDLSQLMDELAPLRRKRAPKTDS